MYELSISNFKHVYRSNQIPAAVGRSFLYTTIAATILNGGMVFAALTTGSLFAAITFAASLISPLVAGLFGESSSVTAGKYKGCLIDLAVLVTTFAIVQLVLNIYVSPLILGVSVLVPLVLTNNTERPVGRAMTIMSPPGILAASIFSLVENNF